MSRVKLDLPDKFKFSTEVQVRISDINYGGHLGNDATLSLIHEARVRFLNKYGFSESDIDGVGLIMVDAVVIYKSEGFYSDALKIDVTVADLSKSGCDFIYRITNKLTSKEVARAKTGIVFFDYKKRKVVAVPKKFNDIFRETDYQTGDKI
jgi:YbgC/YbaW family acyl-CoA thioester hydrolase